MHDWSISESPSVSRTPHEKALKKRIYGQLPLEICSAIQRDLARIDPHPFQYMGGIFSPVPRSE